MTRPDFLLLLLASTAWAGPKDGPEDVQHPRSPDSFLKVVFKPYYCEKCAEEGRIEKEERITSMMRMEVGKLAKFLDLEKGWLVIETPNFKILSTIRRSTVKYKGSRYARGDLERLKQIFPKVKMGREGASLNAHQRAHIYHIRFERLYTHFAALTDNTQKYLGMQSKYQVLLLDQYNPYHKLTDEFIGRGQRMAGVQHHMKQKPNYNMFATSEQQATRQGKGKGDRAFNNWVIHNVAHNLIDGHNNYYRETWAWLEEGFGHYYERMENIRTNTFCWSEGKPPSDFLVRKAAARRADRHRERRQLEHRQMAHRNRADPLHEDATQTRRLQEQAQFRPVHRVRVRMLPLGVAQTLAGVRAGALPGEEVGRPPP